MAIQFPKRGKVKSFTLIEWIYYFFVMYQTNFCYLCNGNIAIRNFIELRQFCSPLFLFFQSICFHTLLDYTVKLLSVDDRKTPLLMIIYFIVMDIVRNLVFLELELLHDFCVYVIVRIDGFAFTFYRIYMYPGVIDSSALCYTGYLVFGHKGNHGCVTHFVFLLQFRNCIIVTKIYLRNKLSKMNINQSAVKEAISSNCSKLFRVVYKVLLANTTDRCC